LVHEGGYTVTNENGALTFPPALIGVPINDIPIALDPMEGLVARHREPRASKFGADTPGSLDNGCALRPSALPSMLSGSSFIPARSAPTPTTMPAAAQAA